MGTKRIFCIFVLIKTALSVYEPAYLKVCSKAFKHVVESTQCDKGIWFKQPIELGCICIRGVWALSNGFCDEKAVILVGDGHCYSIPFEIRSAKFVGEAKDPFKPKIFVSPSTLDAFYEVKEGNFTPALLSDSSLIIGVNPRQVAQRKDYGLCIDLLPKDYGKPVHIFLNPRRTIKEWTLDQKKEYACPSTTHYSYHVAFGEMFDIGKSKIEPRMLVERHCKQECPGEKRKTLVKVSKKYVSAAVQVRSSGGSGKGNINPSTSKRDSNRHISTGTGDELPERLRTSRTMEERILEMEEMRANATMKNDYYEREVNEQTLRMMQAHVSPLLLNIHGPKVVTREYRYFQQIRLVVEKACPDKYVPKHILRGLLRMFRQLLWETQDAFQHVESGDDSLFKRTLSRLAECAEKTLSPSLLFTTYSESWSEKDKDNLTVPIIHERCPSPMIFAINGTAYNRTDYKRDEHQFIRNYTYLFPPHLKYNSSQVDFVIEAAWKISMIGHYRCSKYFDDETAVDFSHFFHQVQSFFNPHIIKRWYYESSVQATYDVVKMIFPSYDLKKFMFGLDSCLAGTHGFSHFDFSNIWNQRPKIPHTENDISQKRYVLGGATSLLSTKDYAPDPSPPPLSSSRGKREAKDFYMWNGKMRCISDYLDPVLNPDYGYQLPNDCVIPVDPDPL